MLSCLYVETQTQQAGGESGRAQNNLQPFMQVSKMLQNTAVKTML